MSNGTGAAVAALLARVKAQVVDGRILKLVESFLQQGVMEEAKGWSPTDTGTPQGGVISPLLANIYMNRFLRAWRERRMGERFRARVVKPYGAVIRRLRGVTNELQVGGVSAMTERANDSLITTKIKARLLDQRSIAGVGNLLADETLWRARLPPWRVAGGVVGWAGMELLDAVGVRGAAALAHEPGVLGPREGRERELLALASADAPNATTFETVPSSSSPTL